MKFFALLVLVACLTQITAVSIKQEKKEDKQVSRQLEYISLINTLLQQSNVLSSVDGVLLAVTTVLASLVSRMKPVLIASSMSYFLYVAAMLFVPGVLTQFGLPPLNIPDPQFSARSINGGSNVFDGILTDTFVKGIQVTPIMNVITNISVSVITDTMTRLRMMSRMLVQQLSLLQGQLSWYGRVLSNECVTKFMCRVGQFTSANFPMASSILLSMAESYPGMDDFAVAVVRGTASSNCSLIYPDCIL